MKTTFFVTALALAARVAFAIPPACLLHAVNTQQNPADLGAVCGKNATSVQSYMASNCGNNADTAQKAFLDTCSSAGTSVGKNTIEIHNNTDHALSNHTNNTSNFTAISKLTYHNSPASYTATKSSSGTFVYTTAVYNSSCHCTQTVVTSATGQPGSQSTGLVTGTAGSGSASRSSGSSVSTAGANVEYKKGTMGPMAAAAIALVGAVAAL